MAKLNDVFDLSKLQTQRGCARCGEDHIKCLLYKKFVRPVVDEDGTEWTEWATCPTTGDPILGRYTERV